ncbi:MAG: hypothetical protein Q4A42_02005 [Tissierellia bacterium]|nr:hypothetical protein [Tissierellia bacterium]
MDSQITHENVEKESAFYISSEILVEMYLLGLISLEEYEEITCYNIEELTPFLSKIMR